MMTFDIHSNIHDYVASIAQTPEFIAKLAALEHAYYVIDENVWHYYRTTILSSLPEQNTIVFPISEDRKNLGAVQELYDKLVNLPAKRNLTMVSMGGGILQDITGFAASTLYRGINWIFVPTTLLAQADSCIGSKTSLNYGDHKNLLGTFFPPSQVHIYPPFLATLKEADFYSGVGEVIKLHVLGGQKSLDDLAQRLPNIARREPTSLLGAIRQSLEVKLKYMEGDEFDHGRRRLLNYGHDFGHALESASHFAIPHGQAVIVGMLAANVISVQRSLLSARTERKLAETFFMPNLIVKPSQEMLERTAIIDSMKKDKKRTDANLALIVMEDDFNFALIHDLKLEEVAGALDIIEHEYLA